MIEYILNKLDEEGVVLVASAGNHAVNEGQISRYPAMFAASGDRWGTISNLIVVGSTDKDTHQATSSQFADYLTTYAPGVDVYVPNVPSSDQKYKTDRGTSFGEFMPPFTGGTTSVDRRETDHDQPRLKSPPWQRISDHCRPRGKTSSRSRSMSKR